MMHGVVMKITERYIVVLCEDGKFRNLPHPIATPLLGEKIVVEEEVPQEALKKRNLRIPGKRWLTAACIGLLIGIALLLKTIGTPASPVAMVAIDINPSVELWIDGKGDVSRVSLINDDAKWLVAEKELSGKEFYQAVKLIMEKAKTQGYLDPRTDKKFVLMSVVDLESDSFRIDPQKLGSKDGDIQIELFRADREQVERAKQAGLTLNKYAVYEDAKQKGIELNVKELRNHSVIATLEKAGVDPQQFFNRQSEASHPTYDHMQSEEKTESTAKQQEQPVAASAGFPKEQQAEKQERAHTPQAETKSSMTEQVKVPEKQSESPTANPPILNVEKAQEAKEQKRSPALESTEIRKFELKIEFVSGAETKLTYTNKDGEPESHVERVTENGQERLQGEQAAKFVTDVLNRLALSAPMSRQEVQRRVLMAMQVDQKEWKKIEINVIFSSEKNMGYDYENTGRTEEKVSKSHERKDDEGEKDDD